MFLSIWVFPARNPPPRTCAASNEREIFGRRKTKQTKSKVWRSVFATVAHLSTAQTSVRFTSDGAAVADGKRLVESDPFGLTDDTVRKRGQQEERIHHHHHHHHCHIMLFGKKRTTNIDNDTTMHSLTPERERWLAREESGSLTHLALAENRRFNMTSRFICRSFST